MSKRPQKKKGVEAGENEYANELFVFSAVISTLLASASLGVMFALGYSILGIEFHSELDGWWGLCFVVSYLVLATGLIVGVRRNPPPPHRKIVYAGLVIATSFVAVLLVAGVGLAISLNAFPPW